MILTVGSSLLLTAIPLLFTHTFLQFCRTQEHSFADIWWRTHLPAHHGVQLFISCRLGQFKAMRNFFKKVSAEEAQSQLLKLRFLLLSKKEHSTWVDHVLSNFLFKRCIVQHRKNARTHQQLCSAHVTIKQTCHLACWKLIYCHKKTEFGISCLCFLLSTFKMVLATDPAQGSRLTSFPWEDEKVQ